MSKFVSAIAVMNSMAPVIASEKQATTGTIEDMEHIVIFMQENRAFDHYYGKLRGVRGFNDRMAPKLPNGNEVFRQPFPESYYPQCTTEQNTACTDSRKANKTDCLAYPRQWYAANGEYVEAWHKGRKNESKKCDFPYLYEGKKYYGCERIHDDVYRNAIYATGACKINGTWNEDEGAYEGGEWGRCQCPMPAGYQLPFPVNYINTSATCMSTPGMSWAQDHEILNEGKMDAWLTARDYTGYSMGHITRNDMPYYYALADAFTIGDQYHQSVLTQTDPNRLHMFTGTNGLGQLFEPGTSKLKPLTSNVTCPSSLGDPFSGGYMEWNPESMKDLKCTNVKKTSASNLVHVYNKLQTCGNPWESIGETLQKAGITWKVYQEKYNFGDNGMEWQNGIREAAYAVHCNRSSEYQEELVKRGLATTGLSACDGSGGEDPNTKRPGSLADGFEADVKAGKVPQVSFVVAGSCEAEHETYHPQIGEALSSRMIDVLKRNPDFYAKSAFIINYDEGGQFFDHQWLPLPPKDNASGKSTVATQGEIITHEMYEKGYMPTQVHTTSKLQFPAPQGLGFRVPLMVVSPWSRGGYVFSETSDHTSLHKLIEKRFPRFKSPNISPWRRAMTSDLTAAFNFSHPNFTFPDLPSTAGNVKASIAQCANDPIPPVPTKQRITTQEPGQRPARALPYELEVTLRSSGTLQFDNTGDAGASFIVYDELNRTVPPKHYSVEARKELEDSVAWLLHDSEKRYSISVFGPNGFARTFVGSSMESKDSQELQGVAVSYVVDVVDGQRKTATALRLTLPKSDANLTAEMKLLTYWGAEPKNSTVAFGSTQTIPVVDSDNWYDVELSVGTATMRLLGRVEDGLETKSDPAMAVRHHHFQDASRAIGEEEMTAMNAALVPVPDRYVSDVKGYSGPPIKPGTILGRSRRLD